MKYTDWKKQEWQKKNLLQKIQHLWWRFELKLLVYLKGKWE